MQKWWTANFFAFKGCVLAPPPTKKALCPEGSQDADSGGPSKIIAVGLNYADHARESGKSVPKEPLFWLKAPTSLLPDGGKIEIPFSNHRTDFEAELTIVIGRRIRNVTPAAAARYIFATLRRRTSATARSNIPKASGRDASRSTRLRRWALT